MIRLKSKEEIETMAEGGRRLKKVMAELLPEIKAGMTTAEIDRRAESLIIKQGGTPSFKRVKDYYWTTCLPINEQVVHTPPGKRKLKTGDVLTIDIGFYYGGFHTDHAVTFTIGGGESPEVSKFLRTGEETLKKAIGQAKAGNYLGQISQEIQNSVEKEGYHILRQLTGHGIGRELHEDPYVLGFVDSPINKTYKIRPGLVIAIEIIYSMGTEEIATEKGSNWSLTSADLSLTACFEHTVAILDNKTLVLT